MRLPFCIEEAGDQEAADQEENPDAEAPGKTLLLIVWDRKTIRMLTARRPLRLGTKPCSACIDCNRRERGAFTNTVIV